jgi:hypothetical protein
MRMIALITHSADIRQIPDHLRVQAESPKISAASGPPLQDDCGGAQIGEGVKAQHIGLTFAVNPTLFPPVLQS